MKPKTLSYTDQDRRYWRRRANLKVRKAKITRALLRWSLITLFHLGIVAAILFTAGKALRHASRMPEFSVARIQVGGNERTDMVSVRALMKPLLGTSLLEADLEAVAGKVERLPWVLRASVKRKLPRTLRIIVEERVPAVNAVIGGSVHVVDETGHVICPAGPGASFDLPVLTGLGRLEGDALRDILIRGVAILERLRQADPAWTAQISRIDLSRDDRVAVTTLHPGPTLLLDPNTAERNLNPFLALSGEIRRRIGEAEYVDLRWRDRISVMPGAGS
jgi:cell division septal protein FtsQ